MTKLLDFLTLERESGVSRYTWRLWVRQRRLGSVRLGRRVLVPEEDFLRFIKSGRVEARKDAR